MGIANPDRTVLFTFPLESPPTENFTDDDLRLIMAMCQSANPWFPDRSMLPAWKSLFSKAERMLESRE